MDKLVINGGKPLEGEVTISGAKNAALPLMAASLLAPGMHSFSNVPRLRDVSTMIELLRHLGAKPVMHDLLQIHTDTIRADDAPYDLVRTMRASCLVMGPLVARLRHAKVSLPGGCAIGARPIDLHLKALEAMGARVTLHDGYVDIRADKLHGARIIFDTITVTGTENIMMAATLAPGETVIENAAQEPEVSDLAHYLCAMGAKIHGAGTSRITIQGVTTLNPATHAVPPDRIEAGTFLIAAAITDGNVLIHNCPLHALETLILKLSEAGAEFELFEHSLRVKGNGRPRPVNITTAPHPGFATDLQAQFMALMTVAQGTSLITETIFENRFMHVSELARLGADIAIEGSTAVVKGKPKLTGAPVMATDLRASASLVLAGLIAEGTTEVRRVYHLDRGYEAMEQKLLRLGASIIRVADDH